MFVIKYFSFADFCKLLVVLNHIHCCATCTTVYLGVYTYVYKITVLYLYSIQC